jgi:hypothetical protein
MELFGRNYTQSWELVIRLLVTKFIGKIIWTIDYGV